MKYACFILTYKRPNATTPNMLRKHGYKGEYFLVVSDNDPCLEEYKKAYGDKVLVFHKPDYAWVDSCDLDPSLDFATIARYAAYDAARARGYDAWCMLDDDLSDLKYRAYDENHSLKTYEVTRLDEIMEACFEAVMKFPKGTIFSFFPSAMMFPGRIDKFERFASQFYFRDTRDGYYGKGRIHEDLIELFRKSSTGELAFCMHEITYNSVVFESKSGGSSDGGMLSEYKRFSTYERCFKVIINNPNFFRISINDSGEMKCDKVLSNYVRILDERHRKL